MNNSLLGRGTNQPVTAKIGKLMCQCTGRNARNNPLTLGESSLPALSQTLL